MELARWLSEPCYNADICGYTIFIPPSAVGTALTYLLQYYRDPDYALIVLSNSIPELATDEGDIESLNVFVEVIEQLYLMHGMPATIKLLYLYYEYLTNHSVWRRTFYALINCALTSLYIPSGVPHYAAVHLMKPLHAAIRYVDRSVATRSDEYYEDIWLIGSYILHASVHNYSSVIETAEKMSRCRHKRVVTLSEFLP